MAIKVTSLSDASKFWSDGATARAGRYAVNTPAAAQDWAANAAAAAPNYKAAVTSPNIDKMFSGGIAKAGAAKFQRKTAGVGKDRFSPGVQAAKGDYEAGEAPMLETIAGVSLPAKKMRGDPANQQRSVLIQVALNKKRLALKGVG